MDVGSEILAMPPADVLAAANIMPATGLATDYLNVFNEAVMLFAMLSDMPDMIDELRGWRALSYEEHFVRSGFQAKDLAIQAYRAADPAVREPFDQLCADINAMLRAAVADVEAMLSRGEPIADYVTETGFGLQSAIMLLDGMVHGGQAGGAQDDIDALFD